MLPKSRRLSTKQVKSVVEKGRMLHSPFFAIRAINIDKPSSFSVSVSKKVAKTAVLRNSIRRRVYSAVSKVINDVNPGQYVFLMAKNGIEKRSLEEILSEIKEIFVKIKVLK